MMMMTQDDQGLTRTTNSSTTTRRALNCLQYTSNGKDRVGLSPRKTTRFNIMENVNKKIDMNVCGINQPLSKNRTSISLPDISSKATMAARSPALLALCASTSTPHRKANSSNNNNNNNNNNKSASNSKSPNKLVASRKNISVILEEKENPNAAAAAAAALSSRTKTPKFKSSSVQCNLIDELMLTGDDKTADLTPYWKMMAHKRLAALDEAELETAQVNRHMVEMNEANEALRNKIACYAEILRQYEEIKNQILESIECCDEDDEDEDDDSGYEKSSLSA